MHKYTNSKRYGMTSVKSEFRAYEPEPVSVPEPFSQAISRPKPNRFLPGEKLLKKLNTNKQKMKPLDLKMIEKSISDILDNI